MPDTTFVPIPSWPGFEINRAGGVRRSDNKKALHVGVQRGKLIVRPYITGGERKSALVAVLLDESFGPGTAAQAGLLASGKYRDSQEQKPFVDKSRKGRYTRKCHDCQKPTNNYRCNICWAKIRGGEIEAA